MKIVYVSPRIPFPLDKGDRIRAHHHLRHLSRNHEVHLVSLVESSDLGEATEPWLESCASKTLLPLGRVGSAARAAGAFASEMPLVTAMFAAPQLERTVRERCGSDTDVLWICNSALFPILAEVPARHLIVDMVDVDSEKWRQWASHYTGPRASIYQREARLTRANEAAAARAADRCLVVSDAEAAQLGALDPSMPPACVVSNGVDLDAYPLTPPGDEPVIVFTGALDYAPNVDAVLYFASAVLPAVRAAVPRARFLAVGRRPTRRVLAGARRHGFEVAADVPEIQPYFAIARVAVAPMRIGRGLQNKVLEAMASGVAVVATPLALLGLAAWPEQTAVPSESAAGLASACIELLSEPCRADPLVTAARRFVRERHSWDAVFERIDDILAGLDARPKPSAASRPAVE